MSRSADTWILTAQCPSRLGTVDVVTRFLKESRCYITEQQSFDDSLAEHFFIRTEFRPLDADFDPEDFHARFANRAAEFEMAFDLTAPDSRVPVVIMVSKADHCLNDLLYRYRTGQLPIEIRAVVSNHPDLKPLADWHGLPYHHLPVTPETKAEQEAEVWQVIEETGAELVILARYMQVLSSELCERLAGRAINIHHSLLPGFKGAKPTTRLMPRASSWSALPLTTSMTTWTRGRSLPRAWKRSAMSTTRRIWSRRGVISNV